MPFIPVIIPHSNSNTVINKTIVYSDTVLPLNDKGSNLKVTSISNVENNELERCLKTIFDNNSNITFNTIQYSRKDKKVYFYTNKNINTKCWEEINIRTYDYVDSSNLLEVIDNVLNQPMNMDNSLTSVYLISKLSKEFYDGYERKEKFLRCKLRDVLKQKVSQASNVFIESYKKDGELEISFDIGINEFKSIVFARTNNEIFIKKSESPWDMDILTNAYDVIDAIFDHYENKNVYHESYKSVNSPLWVHISNLINGVGDDKYYSCSNFYLRRANYKDGIETKCNSSKVLGKLEGRKNELLKKVFVKISECPEILQKPLQELRQQEIIYNLKEQEKEFKKQQRKEKIEKIFPFIKKR